jgi:alkylhydroperoxidase family enzyme
MSEKRVGRLSVLPLEGTQPEVQEIFGQFLKERGNVPNMFRTVGHRPRHLKTMIDHFVGVMRLGTVPSPLKEMISVRVSALNGCRY